MKKLKIYFHHQFVMDAFFIQVKKKIKKKLIKINKIAFSHKKENLILFSCGLNGFHQKGIFTKKKCLISPTEIDYFKNVKIENIFTGDSHTFIKNKSKYFFNIFFF
jgi:hypothetical protein